MQITPQSDDLKLYLLSSDIIDFDNMNFNEIIELADKIANQSDSRLDYIKNAYEYVRDRVAHSADINGINVTCKASEVLKDGHGICFAKSHLLAALLRCKSIPAGFCYQKLILDDKTAPFLIFHGLNGVYIEEYNKWIRLDARGNKNGVNAQFSTDEEKLAYPVCKEKGEEDITIIFYEPDKNVIKAMTENKTRAELWNNLPKELAK